VPRTSVSRGRLFELLRQRRQLHLHRRSHDHGWYLITEPKSAAARALCGSDRCVIIRLTVAA